MKYPKQYMIIIMKNNNLEVFLNLLILLSIFIEIIKARLKDFLRFNFIKY